jgi:hypothetical protein
VIVILNVPPIFFQDVRSFSVRREEAARAPHATFIRRGCRCARNSSGMEEIVA